MIQSAYDAEMGVMIHVGHGEIALQEIVQAIAQWFKHEEFDPATPVLWDFSDAFLAIASDELAPVYDIVRAATDRKRKGGRTAWVHWSSLTRSLIELIFAEFDWGSDWQTFASREAGLRWVLEQE